jgi:D-alanine-D-alanine ligase
MPAVKVLILYNDPVLPPGHPDFDSEHDVLHTVEAVGASLAEVGFAIDRLGLKRDPSPLLERLANNPPNVVFNLFEGLADHGQTEGYVAGLLDWSGVRFTGCPSEALCIARSKHLAKYLLRGVGLPTAAFTVIAQSPVPRCSLAWPVIVKPALEDGSIGLDQGSVVTDQAGFRARVECLLNEYGPPVLVEEFIDGREFNVAVIEMSGGRAHVVSEIVFQDHPSGHWRIVTYDAKWKPESREFQSTPARCPASISPEQTALLKGLANQAFDLFGCRDYARIDFRMDASGKAYLIEVNPNPDLGPDAGLAKGLASVGLTYGQFVVHLVENALGRQPAEKA